MKPIETMVAFTALAVLGYVVMRTTSPVNVGGIAPKYTIQEPDWKSLIPDKGEQLATAAAAPAAAIGTKEGLLAAYGEFFRRLQP